MSNHDEDKPEFKPGNTVALQFGHEILNGNIDWRGVLKEILEHSDYTIEDIATKLAASAPAVYGLLSDDTSGLGFKQGAQLLGLHFQVMPEDKISDRDWF